MAAGRAHEQLSACTIQPSGDAARPEESRRRCRRVDPHDACFILRDGAYARPHYLDCRDP